MIGQNATVVRVKETLGFLTNRLGKETFTIRGVITGVQETDGRVSAVEINGVRVEDGSRRRSWLAVGSGAATGLIISHTDSLDACGHGITDGCTCAADTALPLGTGDVIETADGVREGRVSASEADSMVALFEGDRRYDVRRRWDAVAYVVAIARRGSTIPFLSYMVPVN